MIFHHYMQFYVHSLWVDCKGVLICISPSGKQENEALIWVHQFSPLSQRGSLKFGFCKNNKTIHLKGLNLHYGINHRQIINYSSEGEKARHDSGYKSRWGTSVGNCWVNSALGFGISLHGCGRGSHVCPLIVWTLFIFLILCYILLHLVQIRTVKTSTLSFGLLKDALWNVC